MDALVFNSLVDARVNGKYEYVLNNEVPSIVECSIVNVELVSNEDSETKTLGVNDVVFESDNLSKIKTSLRMDVFKFYNKEFTNFVNRKLRNITEDKGLKNGVIIGNPPNFNDYASQYDEIRKMSLSKANYLEKAISMIDTRVLHTDDKIKEDYGFEGVLSLVSTTKIKFLYADFINIPDNNNISKTKSVLLGKRYNITNSIALAASEYGEYEQDGLVIVDKELVIANKDKFYIVDKTPYGNLTIRELDILEFNAKEII